MLKKNGVRSLVVEPLKPMVGNQLPTYKDWFPESVLSEKYLYKGCLFAAVI